MFNILMKLFWAKLSGGSEKQLFDAANVYEMQSGTFNQSYLNTWITELELGNEFTAMKRFLENGISFSGHSGERLVRWPGVADHIYISDSTH
jgi:hypothetical protein